MQRIVLLRMVCLIAGYLFPSDGAVFQPLEDVICQVFIPALTGCSPPSDSVRQLFALPARWGGLGVFVPISGCASELSASRSITEPLCQCVRDHTSSIVDAFSAQLTRRNAVHRARSLGLHQFCQQFFLEK